MSKRLENCNVVVTGGSRGIGAEICRTLAAEGATVALTFSSREEAAQEVLKSLEGSGHFCLQMNIADEESINSGFKRIMETFGSLHGLVNNAGITRDQLVMRMKPDDFDAVVNTNLRGTFLCMKAVLKPMVKARNGSIVNITSVIGQTGNPGQCNYAASKAGVEAMSKSLAQELGSRNLRINCVAPGFIETDMTDQLTDEQKTKIHEKIPLQCIGETKDVAASVAFLISDEAKYITGHTLDVNGGLFMK